MEKQNTCVTMQNISQQLNLLTKKIEEAKKTLTKT